VKRNCAIFAAACSTLLQTPAYPQTVVLCSIDDHNILRSELGESGFNSLTKKG
jgi:hypothetical protein